MFLIAVAPTIVVEMWRTPHERKLERLRHASGAILLLLCALYIIFMLAFILMERRYPASMGNDLMFDDEMWGSLLILSTFLVAGLLLWRKGEVGMGLKWFSGSGLLWFIFVGLGNIYIDSIHQVSHQTSIEPEETILMWISLILGSLIVLGCPLLAYRYPVQSTDEEE
jgi:tellurite resistance protein TehA-like permease